MITKVFHDSELDTIRSFGWKKITDNDFWEVYFRVQLRKVGFDLERPYTVFRDNENGRTIYQQKDYP